MSLGIDFNYERADRPLGDDMVATGAKQTGSPIERLNPKGELHAQVLAKLTAMLDLSKREMTKFHTRWRSNEYQYQAYLNTKTLDELKKAGNARGTAPEFVALTVPYTYSALQTVVTYLLHTFCGRKPMFNVGSYREDNVRLAENMETVLQYNADHERLIRKLYQFFQDGEKYGLQVLRVLWKTEQRTRTKWKDQSILGFPAIQTQVQETATTFEGNDLFNIDPFNFFPDPRVPMDEVAKRGEFCFWQTVEGKHSLKKAEVAGLLSYIDHISLGNFTMNQQSQSARARLAEGSNNPVHQTGRDENYIVLEQGSVEIVPSKWGLGDGDQYEKWLFTIANGNTIIQAEPLSMDHNLHPIIVGEPYSEGYSFGNIGLADMLGPMQDMLSWMLNSHIFNVRAVLNNTLVVNPQMVDMEDLKKPGPGRVIKLKPAAFGQDIKTAVQQLAVQDVTRSHITDLQVITRFADMISATTDNLRGVQAAGGRKTATEVRTSGEAGASRLAAHARLISAQSISPLAEMQAINLQQNMTEALYVRLLGRKATEAPVRIGPDDISGDFYFPVHDGTLPLDRVALLDTWKEIFLAVVQNPVLAPIFDAVGMFEYIAELGGAKNLSTFKVQGRGNEEIAGALQAGNVIPLPTAAAELGGRRM